MFKLRKSQLSEIINKCVQECVESRNTLRLDYILNCALNEAKRLNEEDLYGLFDPQDFNVKIEDKIKDETYDVGYGGYTPPKATKRISNDFYRKIRQCTLEREVEDVYVEYLTKCFNTQMTHTNGSDGEIYTKTPSGKELRVLFEFKYNKNFANNRLDMASVLCQVIYYMKSFENKGKHLPNICFIGDIDECFVLHTNPLLKYLDEEGVNWKSAASSAAKSNPELMYKIADDKEISPLIIRIDDNFDFKSVMNKMCDLADNVKRLIHINVHNIGNIYNVFVDQVIKDKNITTKESVECFVGSLVYPDEYYQHPKNKNMLVTPNGGKVAINSFGWDAFFSYFSSEHTPSEISIITGIADRLIEDTDRRKSGDFWTPTAWVDYAHQRLDDVLGENWREEFVVWDNCCGTKNLTRDYKFGELYCSTLFDQELQIGRKYNPEAECFQFDFLNDYIPNGEELWDDGRCKLPKGLVDAFEENKKILFLINPPYATAGNWNETSKKGAAKTDTNLEMLKNGYGACSQNLYAQFLYRIEKIKRDFNLTNLYIGIFCPTLFMTGGSYDKFRSYFLNDFEYLNGFQFQASHFADVASDWGIGFTIWKSGECKDKENFEADICDIDKKNGIKDIEVIGAKTLYNIDNSIKGSEWIKCSQKATEDLPHMSSGITIKGKTGKGIKNGLGYIFSKSNNVDSNTQNVALFSTIYSDGHGQNLDEDNFTRCTALFSARKLIEKTWINSKDEYLAPNENHPKFQEFVDDSVVFSLFHSASNQSSLRQIDYKEKKWDIKNEFFWLHKEDMMELAEDNNNFDLYQDAKTSKERYVANLLDDIKLSKEAQDVLDLANQLVDKSFKYRQMYNQAHPEYQINNWDCGYYQLKGLWKEVFPQEFKEFRNAFNKLADKMRPMVYELGFLKQ